MAGPAKKSSGFFYGWVVAGAFSVMMAATWGTSQGTFGVLVNPMTAEEGWSRTAISAAFSIHLIVNFVSGVFWGWASDRWGGRRIALITGALMGLGMYLSGTADSLWQLYLYFGVIGGAGLGGSSGPLAAVASRWFGRRAGLAIGIGFAGSNVGTAGLAVLSERLIASYGWRSSFQALSYLVWGLMFLGGMLLREPGSRSSPESASKASSSEGQGQQARVSTEQPAMPLSVAVRTRPFWLLFGMAMMSALIFFLVLIHLVPRAVDLGIASSSAVAIFTTSSICTMLGALAGGALGDRFGHRGIFISSMVLYIAALVWLIIASELWMFYLFAVVFGLGNGAWGPQLPALAARLFGTRYLGAILGTIFLGAGIGATLGPIIAGYAFDATGSYRIAFAIGAGIACGGLLFALPLVVRPRARLP